MILSIFNGFNETKVHQLALSLRAEDALVLIDDASFLLGCGAHEPPGYTIYAIKDDIECRGVVPHPSWQVTLISHDDLVDLTARADRVHCW